MLTVKAGQAFQLVPVANELMNSYGNIISLVDSIIHLENEQSNIHIQPRFNNRMLIRLLLFFSKTTLFTSRPQNFVLFVLSFFFKSRVRAISDVQTQANSYMYPIFLPVIDATDLLENTMVKLRSVYVR